MRKSILYPVLIIVSTLLLSCEKEVDPALLPVVSTTEVSSVSYYSAQSGGIITGDGGYVVTARGACWSTSPNPDINGSKTVDAAGTGTFESSIDSLMPGTTYYLRAYATNKKGTSYGLQETFTTMPLSLSEVTTSPVTSITTTTAVTGGTISIDGGTPITARGVCWSTLPNPTINDSVTIDGSGSGNFISTLSGLKTGTIYYVKAYATNSNGTAYGNERQFKTQTSIPEVITSTITSITSSSAISGGDILHDGGASITARGVCWSISPNPTINNSKTVNGTGNGSYTSTLSNLKSGTQYYVRAYATNSKGTAYGNEFGFTSLINLPELTTSAVTDIASNTAKSGGIITNDGGAIVTARGVCWSTNQNPTIADSKTSNGMGTGVFVSSIDGLIPRTTYYVRAYATNCIGSAYGEQQNFTTSDPTTATLSTNFASSITSVTATCGGNISDDGGATVTARGVCWSTNQNPTIADSKTSNGLGTGVFVSSIDGLTAGTTYYVRAYATNSIGTAYGNAVEFTTKNVVFEVEYNNEMMYANLLTEGITMGFSLDTSDDIDWFKIYVPEGKLLNYKLEVPADVSGIWRLIIYNSSMVQGNVNNISKTYDNRYPVNKSDYYYFKISPYDSKFLYSNRFVKLTVTLSHWY